MEELLKLLISNIYVVIIVVGFLLTLLNKARNKQKPGGNRMPTFGGGPDGSSQARPIAERPPQPERQQSRTQEAELRPAAQRRQTAAPEAGSSLGGTLYKSQEKPSGEGDSMELIGSGLLSRSMETGKQARSQPKAIGRTTPVSSRAKGDSFRVPQGNELRQAFIMAEVLGPPRSKRPLKQK